MWYAFWNNSMILAMDTLVEGVHVSSTAIEVIRTLLFFSQKILKRKKTNLSFKQIKNFLVIILEL